MRGGPEHGLPSWATIGLFLILACAASSAQACPFCTALKPTLAQQFQSASAVALVEAEEQLPGKSTRVRVHRALSRPDTFAGHETLDIPLDVTPRPGSLLLVFGSGPRDADLARLTWHSVSVNEGSYAYFAKALKPAGSPAERLRRFAPYLEHADPLIAEDAYLEFGHAPFDQVASVADVFDMAKVRGWLTAARVPPERKGFYGLVLGLATDPGVRQANSAALRSLAVAPEDDFRAGFDGILGGLLLLEGVAALELIESRILANPQSADGDVRHAMTALRFYHEYGDAIPLDRQQAALRLLLSRSEFAAAAITDLARWQDWSAVERIAKLYDGGAAKRASLRQAVVGYLLACPTQEAAAALAKLRAQDPAGIATAEQVLTLTNGLDSAKQ